MTGQQEAMMTNKCDQKSVLFQDGHVIEGGSPIGSGGESNGSRRKVRRLSNGSVQSDCKRDVSSPVSQESINTATAAVGTASPRKALHKHIVGFGLKSSKHQSNDNDVSNFN